jgi:hypothetical protein
MGGIAMPAQKKNTDTRRRRNKAATASTLRRLQDEATPVEVYEAMTVAQLREAIDVVNQSRPADAQIPKKGAKATLVAVLVAAERQIPDMPKHPPRWQGDDETGWAVEVDWHTQTEAWWNDVWTSPMAAEWDDSDLHNMFVLALLYDDIWTADTPRARKEALAEFRLQRADLGLSPYSRRRLEWTIETADELKARGEKRRAASWPATPKAPGKGPDPRLHLIS